QRHQPDLLQILVPEQKSVTPVRQPLLGDATLCINSRAITPLASPVANMAGQFHQQLEKVFRIAGIVELRRIAEPEQLKPFSRPYRLRRTGDREQKALNLVITQNRIAPVQAVEVGHQRI